MTDFPEGEGPVDPAEARARAAAEHSKPEHQYRPGVEGHDLRDKVADTDLTDPQKQEKP